MAKFSLSDLKPQIIDVKIDGHSEPIVITLRPLTYVEWNNCIIDLPRPTAPTIRAMIDGKSQDIKDFSNFEYQQAATSYRNTIAFRRLAIALEGGGFKELKGKSQDEQVELLQDMDTGIVNALVALLNDIAETKSAERFQPEPISENNHADLSQSEMVSNPELLETS